MTPYAAAAARASATATSRYSTKAVFDRLEVPVPPEFPICMPTDRQQLAIDECDGVAYRVPDDVFTQYLPPCEQVRLPTCDRGQLPVNYAGSTVDPASASSTTGTTLLWIIGAAVVAGGAAWYLTR